MTDIPLVLGSATYSALARDNARAKGFHLVDLHDVPPAPWDLNPERIVATGVLRTEQDVTDAIHVVARGGGLIAELRLDTAQRAALFDDLHRLRPDASLGDALTEVTETDRALIRLLASGSTLTSAAKSLFISRRTAVRRLARLRALAGADSNHQAILWCIDRGLAGPVASPPDPQGQHWHRPG